MGKTDPIFSVVLEDPSVKKGWRSPPFFYMPLCKLIRRLLVQTLVV